jgi:hypothetical protein
MRIIEINTLENGSHRNQNGIFDVIPNGWAVIPDDMETPNFPYGDIEVADEDIIRIETELIDGEEQEVEKVIGTRKVVTKWIAKNTEITPFPVPKFEDPTTGISTNDVLNTLLGVTDDE